MSGTERENEKMNAGKEAEKNGKKILLAIDTCGDTGSVALGAFKNGSVELLSQRELEGRTFAASLIPAVGELLAEAGIGLDSLAALIAVRGPGSFTGVRVGLSAVKGLAEEPRLPVLALSRLAVLHSKAFPSSSATASAQEKTAAVLDAHRHELYLRLVEPTGQSSESLATAEELAAILPPPASVAVCDAGTELIAAAWPTAKLVRLAPPTAADALQLAAGFFAAAAFADLEELDGHYLRRSDAEIFGARPAAKQS